MSVEEDGAPSTARRSDRFMKLVSAAYLVTAATSGRAAEAAAFAAFSIVWIPGRMALERSKK